MLPLLALSLLIPQEPIIRPIEAGTADVVSGVLQRGRMPIDAFGLGAGGIAAGRADSREVSGELRTRGGVLVRARNAGVKLDFPSRAELLVSPDGRVHVRSGEFTMPNHRPFELWLADGARVYMVPEPSGRLPLRWVEVAVAKGNQVLWAGRRRINRAARARRPVGTPYLAMGNGEVLYRAVAIGPLFVLERALCPRALERDYPKHKLVVAGDVLAASMRRLPAVVPPRAVQFPQAPKAAAELARLADVLFAPGVRRRPYGTVGAMLIPLAGDYRLSVEDRGGDAGIALGLYRAGVDVPAVEWTIRMRTELHLVRPSGGGGGGPRYFGRGIDLRADIDALWPLQSPASDIARARRVLRQMGGRELPRAAEKAK